MIDVPVLRRAIGTLAPVTVAQGFGSEPPMEPGPIATVTVTSAALDTLVGRGATIEFPASGLEADGTAVPGTYSWTSSDPFMALVSATGLMTVQRTGTSTIPATEAGGISGTATFTAAAVLPVHVEALIYDGPTGSAHHPMGMARDGALLRHQRRCSAVTPPPVRSRQALPGFVEVNANARTLLYNGGAGTTHREQGGPPTRPHNQKEPDDAFPS